MRLTYSRGWCGMVAHQRSVVWVGSGVGLLVAVSFCVQNVFIVRSRNAEADALRRRNLPPVEMPRDAFVITMDNASGWAAALALQQGFEIENMQVLLGHVGNASGLPLYNRYVMQTGRTDDLQIGNLNMLGCLESHREVWSRVSRTSYVFEHDAKPSADGMRIVQKLLRDSTGRAWSVMKLSAKLVTGEHYRVGELSESCRGCISFGTRGYIVTKAGAQILLDNYHPPVVQVDAYMSLLNAYHANFTLVWSVVQAVDWIPQLSTIQMVWDMHALNRWLKKKQ
jgi:hypothetical protein